MKPIIPKSPNVPSLSNDDIEFLTQIVFEKELHPEVCDALFIFSGTHPGHWEKAIEAIQKQYAEKIIVTGGKSLTGQPHPEWDSSIQCEAEYIIQKLVQANINSKNIVFENKSTNTLENVIFAKEIFDFNAINKLMFICKSHATGRQLRTLKKHLPNHIKFIPYTFNTQYENITIDRDNWMNSEIGKSRVWGEYLRILHYGDKGDIERLNIY